MQSSTRASQPGFYQGLQSGTQGLNAIAQGYQRGMQNQRTDAIRRQQNEQRMAELEAQNEAKRAERDRINYEVLQQAAADRVLSPEPVNDWDTFISKAGYDAADPQAQAAVYRGKGLGQSKAHMMDLEDAKAIQNHKRAMEVQRLRGEQTLAGIQGRLGSGIALEGYKQKGRLTRDVGKVGQQKELVDYKADVEVKKGVAKDQAKRDEAQKEVLGDVVAAKQLVEKYPDMFSKTRLGRFATDVMGGIMATENSVARRQFKALGKKIMLAQKRKTPGMGAMAVPEWAMLEAASLPVDEIRSAEEANAMLDYLAAKPEENLMRIYEDPSSSLELKNAAQTGLSYYGINVPRFDVTQPQAQPVQQVAPQPVQQGDGWE